MSFFGAMTTAVNSIRAQASALGHISDNIANSQTVGFKRTDTSFYDVVTVSSGRNHLPGSVTARPAFTNSVQGVINASDVKTHLAINGDGFFVVSERIATVDNDPVFLNVDRYTRRGDFTVDKNGYLVNGGGYYLQGLAIDPATGNPSGNTPGVIQVTRQFLPAQASTQLDYEVNLPSDPKTVAFDPNTANSELLTAGDPTDPGNPFANDPSTITAPGGPPAINGFVQAGDENIFLDRSLSGGAITLFDPTGNPLNVQLRWAKVDNAADGAGTGNGDTWNLFYKSNDAATGAQPKWVNVGQDYIFQNGQLNPAVNSTTITGLTVNGVNIGNITVNHGSGNVTQFSDPNGKVTVNEIDQDGFAAGRLVEVGVGDNGRVTGSYSNGKTLDLAEISVARFNSPDQLKKIDGTAFAVTQESGEPLTGDPGNIVGEATEASNVDIADEFSKLIITQQAYTAGTRIVTTTDELVQETLNMKR